MQAEGGEKWSIGQHDDSLRPSKEQRCIAVVFDQIIAKGKGTSFLFKTEVIRLCRRDVDEIGPRSVSYPVSLQPHLPRLRRILPLSCKVAKIPYPRPTA